jgi:hypothetical protein
MKTVAARAMPHQIDTEIFRPSPPSRTLSSDRQIEFLYRMTLYASFSVHFEESNRSSRSNSNAYLQSEGIGIEPRSY